MKIRGVPMKGTAISAAAVVFFILGIAHAWGQIIPQTVSIVIWVDASAKGGSPDGSTAKPFLTLTEAGTFITAKNTRT
ncbi:MAG: hypothetical protein EHM28_12925 [Spirochaetaceae bacterium]|nr:MAG: hypothetical protein EHM28_12925 [Spirochaetaceae bacterium]